MNGVTPTESVSAYFEQKSKLRVECDTWRAELFHCGCVTGLDWVREAPSGIRKWKAVMKIVVRSYTKRTKLEGREVRLTEITSVMAIVDGR